VRARRRHIVRVCDKIRRRAVKNDEKIAKFTDRHDISDISDQYISQHYLFYFEYDANYSALYH
jgi:ribosomal protein L22